MDNYTENLQTQAIVLQNTKLRLEIKGGHWGIINFGSSMFKSQIVYREKWKTCD